MKRWIIYGIITDDNGKKVSFREEFDNQRDFDIRYTHLAENFDDEIKIKIIAK